MKPDFDQTENVQQNLIQQILFRKMFRGNFFQNSTRNPDRTNVGPLLPKIQVSGTINEYMISFSKFSPFDSFSAAKAAQGLQMSVRPLVS